MSMMHAEFGDFAISGSAMTLDDTTPVPIYEFTADKDGFYTVQVLVLAWQPGGTCWQTYVGASWLCSAGVLSVDGGIFTEGSETGSLNPEGITTDVSSGKGRLLVTGVSGEAVFWRVKGDRFDLTA